MSSLGTRLSRGGGTTGKRESSIPSYSLHLCRIVVKNYLCPYLFFWLDHVQFDACRAGFLFPLAPPPLESLVPRLMYFVCSYGDDLILHCGGVVSFLPSQEF